MSSPGEPLIRPAELAALLAGSPAQRPALLDVRWRLGGPPGRDSYLAGHLPGAAWIDLDADLAGPPGPTGRHPLPAARHFTAAMRRAGVRPGTLAVAYDDGDGSVAARLWWCLRYFGHDQARVLDGGFRAWTEAGLPAEAGEPGPAGHEAGETGPDRHESAGGEFTAVPGQMPVLDLAAAARLPRAGTLLDARAAERYRGEAEPVDRAAGHIPGAVSAPAAANVGADGRFLAAAELRARFAALGLAPGAGPVGAYCGSGVTAAHEVLALQLAGIEAALYPGSWSEWVADPARPVATGADPGPPAAAG